MASHSELGLESLEAGLRQLGHRSSEAFQESACPQQQEQWGQVLMVGGLIRVVIC